MNKPLTSWKKSLTALGRRVNWQNFYRAKQRSQNGSDDHSFHRLELESLESRMMLSTVTGSGAGAELQVCVKRSRLPIRMPMRA